MRTLRSFRPLGLLLLVAAAPLWARPRAAPGFPLQGLLPGASAPGSAAPWNIVVLLTLLTLIPAIVLSLTPFVRLLIVFHFLRQALGTQTAPNNQFLLCSTPARFHLRRLLEPFLPKVVVLSPLEIPPMVSVQSLGAVR